jgi:SAM-dependent methyltransferase
MTNYNELFASLEAGRVLDVASGNGYFLEVLLQGAKSYTEAVGVDKKEAAAAAFAETFKENQRVKFAVMDAAHLDFADNSFDTVCVSNSLHHLEQPTAILDEMKRVIRPGGRFILNEMYADGSQSETQKTHVLLHHWMAQIDMFNAVFHRETYGRQQLVDFAADLGLKHIETYDIADLSEDPKSPEVFSELDPVIDRYIQRAEGHPDLQDAGEKIRQRLRSVGFHSATSLLLLAQK